jgi:transposase InsO family protein
VRRYRAEGEAGLVDRPSTPLRQPTRTSEERVQAIAALRRVRLTGAQIAEALSMPLSTVSGILTRIGLGKLSRLEPPNRYERRHPGELIHVDVKKLGRIQGGAGHRVTGHKHTHVGRDRKRHVGWEYVHVCIDDATRRAYVEVLADEKAATAIGFLRRALGFYGAHGIQVERLMTDNGPAYISLAHALACRALGLRHLRTRPYRPRTNGKASASSEPCWPPGPTAPSTPAHSNEPTPSPSGLTTTTTDDPTSTQSPPAGSPPRAADREQPPRVLQLGT